jgi:uncharacterized protein
MTAILWRRLDTPGHDACRLDRSADGWRLQGTAVFRHEGLPARLAYQVECDLEWRTQQGSVLGWVGTKSIEFRIARTPQGVWRLNDTIVTDLGSCIDLDFGFTPGTNLFQLRRLALNEGQAADAPAAWLDAPEGRLELLPQRYERRSATTYWYESPSVEYAALLEVGPTGFVRRYPGLWEAES